MADTPSEKMLAELRRLSKEASEIAYDHDEYLTLMFMAAVDLERKRELAIDVMCRAALHP